MKKIMIIDGGPRKNMNTAKMIDSFIDGVKSVNEEIEVKHVRLYELDYKGCYACMACKIKGSKFHDYCGHKDGVSKVLKDTAYADGICFASPIFFGSITAQLQAFIERLTFPWLSYNDYTLNAPKRVPTTFIYTMNANDEQQRSVEPGMDRAEGIISMFLTKPERVKAMNTMQVKDYSRYDMAAYPPKIKEAWRDAHLKQDIQNAFDAGMHMVEKIITEK